MRFWDTSAIVPLCVDLPESPQVYEVLRADLNVTVWWASPVECWSAFARHRRDGQLRPDEEDRALAALATLQDSWYEIEPSQEVRKHAARLIRTHALRASDALQLAAALAWTGTSPPGEFVSLDRRLRDAARLEGFTVRP